MDKNELAKQISREFVMETVELCEIVSGSIMDLEKHYDQELVNSVYRVFHTIKGNAFLAGYQAVGELSHIVEDVLSAVKSGKLLISVSIVDHLLSAVDAVKSMVDDIESGGDGSADNSRLLKYFATVLTSSEADTDTAKSSETVQGKEQAIESASPQNLRLQTVDNFDNSDEMQASRRPKKDDSFNMLPRNSFRPLRILIVEDDFTSRQLLVSALKRYGDCHVAKDGLEAIQAVIESYEMVPTSPYDLICMDVQMPNMDGTVAARTIREIERGKSVEGTEFESIIMMISCVEEPKVIMKACYQCGANHYFVKPLNLHQMTRQMQKLGLIGVDSSCVATG
ncbi:MAG: response regulator [Sedimentisphaerales bacterium]|nr:response regulator [Sedimentisphaerales bacterium]MBN2841579.1 response regulator [Sedimentisphaerales bacterium]